MIVVRFPLRAGIQQFKLIFFCTDAGLLIQLPGDGRTAVLPRLNPELAVALEQGPQQVEVLLEGSHLRAVVDGRRRMEHGDHAQGAGALHAAAQAGDALARLQDELGGEVAQGDDDRGVHAGNLLAQPGGAGLDLFWARVAVAGRAALEDVGDVDALARDAGAVEHLVEQLAGCAHEGLALEVLVLAGALAYEHDVGMGIAHPEDEVGARGGQGALGAARALPLDICQGARHQT